MQFRFTGLAMAPFAPLFDLSDAELAARDIRRVMADDESSYPCRVTLDHAEPGERLLLLPYEHQAAHSPYKAAGPIFVREGEFQTYDGTETPPVVKARLLSARAYDNDGMIVDAEVTEGAAIEPVLERLFARPDTAYVHLHNAKRGCYACRVDRA